MKRTKKQAQETRDALLDAAEQAFFHRGVSQTTLEDVARHVGMTRGAIYHHFSNKADLYASMLERVRLPLEELQLAYSAESENDPATVIERLCQWVIERLTTDERLQRVYTIVLHRRERMAHQDQMRDHELDIRAGLKRVFLKCFQAADKRGLLREGITPELADQGLESYLVGLIYLWLLNPEGFDLSGNAKPLIRCHLAGLLRLASVSPTDEEPLL